MRVVLVVNPAARSVRPSIVAATVAQWQRHFTVRTVVTTTGKDVDGDVRHTLRGVDAVVVLSGDGLINRVANVMVAERCDAVLVPLPGGSTNVLARSLGLGRDPLAAGASAAAALSAGRVERIGWGRLDGRGFIVNAGIGFDAAVVRRVELDTHRKARWGHGWFAAASVAELARGIGRPGRRNALRLAEGRPAWWVVALTRHPYTYAGARAVELLPPTLGMGDGLWVLSFGWPAARSLATAAMRSFATSRGVVGGPGVDVRRVTTSLEVRGRTRLDAQVDGEPFTTGLSAVLSWEPNVLVVPRPLLPQPLEPRSAPRPAMTLPTGADRT